MPSSKVSLKPRPPLVDGSVRRDDVLSAMRQAHFEGTLSRRNSPGMTVLTGLGGSGKTKIALTFASEFEETSQGSGVYFLDASSKTALGADLQTLVQSQSDVYEDVLLWIAKEAKDWLVVMDNADDPSVELPQFLPSHDYPHSVATTTEMSLEKLSTQVKDLVSLLSHLRPQSIPRTIVEQAASRKFRHVAMETRLPLGPETLKYADALMSLFVSKRHLGLIRIRQFD
ncbi:hypothetical protein CPB86DRAFT_817791 [Serendipita vermifera]|nr:hypothetical protein CPB86DRAFT_817791 [Serendipita vermifera]